MKKQLKDRVYRLKNQRKPLSYVLPSRHTNAHPLLHFDEQKGTSRALRYATNQQSVFIDEQQGEVILGHVIFESGMLNVPKENQALQQLLHYHPGLDKIFEEVDNERDAQKELARLDMDAEAMIRAREMPIEQLDIVHRVIYGRQTAGLTSGEIRRDVLSYAKNNSEDFLEILSDPNTEVEGNVYKYFEENLLSFRRNKTEVWYNMPKLKSKMLNVPHNANPYSVIADFLKSPEGLDAYKMLDSMLIDHVTPPDSDNAKDPGDKVVYK